jgi:hypothetical protein
MEERAMPKDERSDADVTPELGRRRMLRGAAAGGAGLVAGAVMMSASPAFAAAGDPVVLGSANDAGSTATSIGSTTTAAVLALSQNGASGNALHAIVTNGTGSAIIADGNVTTSSAPVVQATSYGSGFAIYGAAAGTGRAIAGYISQPASTASSVYGATAGSGAGVEGKSDNGRGGKFTGRYAQINLAPGTSSTHPSHGGILGDLYVDLNARLWFCRGANHWVQVV